MNKPVYVHQPWGVGDLIYIQKIIGHYQGRGHEVIVPVRPDLMWMGEQLSLPGVRYVDMTGPFERRASFVELVRQAEAMTPEKSVRGAWETEEMIFLPLGPCYRWCGEPNMMLSKYAVLGLDGSDWPEGVHVARDGVRERRLLEHLALRDGERFCLVNGQGSVQRMHIQVSGMRKVEMTILPGYTLFDWSAVIERAGHIVTIDTSVVLLIEVLRPRAELAMVSRYDPPHFTHVRPIVRLGWRYIPDV